MAWRLALRNPTRSVPLTPGEHIVGSGSGCSVRIPHPTVSGRHARLVVQENQVVVEDLQSSNGTRIDGRVLARPTAATPGQRLAFGLAEAGLERLDDAETEAAMALPHPPEPGVEARRQGTLVTESAGRFAMEEFPALLEIARSRRDPGVLAARMLAALRAAFEDLEFAIETSDGRLLAGSRIDAESGLDAHSAGTIRIRVRGPRPRRTSAATATRLCAGLLDLVSSATTDPTPTPISEPVAGNARRPEPPSVSAAVTEVYDRAERVAPSRLNVLIQGETGTGKELLARFLHAASGRDGEFVAVNCAALSRELLEAELFGIEAGVATGVDAREGRFVQADGGTLLLDEVTEMPDDCQAKLLRVLQEGEVVALGARRPRRVDVRIVAATNREVSMRGESPGPLRADLVHRLSGWPVTLPALRDRSEDIPQLAGHFLARAARSAGRRPAGISRAAMDALCSHDWPGNIRQLEQEMQRAALFVDDGELLGQRHLSAEIERRDAATAALQDVSAEAQRQAIVHQLAAHGGNVSRTARALGISRATLYRRMRDLDIERTDPGGAASS